MPQTTSPSQHGTLHAPNDLRKLEAKLNHSFAQAALLEQALTHSSLRHEQQMEQQMDRQAAKHAGEKTGALPAGVADHTDQINPGDNERLEFLGDAIVGLVVAESLYRRFPELREGELTRLRAVLVSRRHLGEVGERLKLGKWLRMGRSEEKNGGRKKALLLANCVEALTAALYLDAGLSVAAGFVESAIVEPHAGALHGDLRAKRAIGDYKSALQEFLQAQGRGQPEYAVQAATGPDHRKRFLIEVRSAPTDADGGRALARGSGNTKKKAEQEAARRAFLRLGGEGAPAVADAITDAHPAASPAAIGEPA